MPSTEKQSILQTRLIQGGGNAMEIGQISAETTTDEPVWLKILCFLGAVYPILEVHQHCRCYWKILCWSVVPLLSSGFWIIAASKHLMFSYPSILAKVWYVVLFSLPLLLQLSLSYTRKGFTDAIVAQANRLDINAVGQKVLIITFAAGVIICGILSVIATLLQGVITTSIVCQCAVVIVRCLFLTHGSVTQVKLELLSMANGTEVSELQSRLLEINKVGQEVLEKILKVPLILFYVLGMMLLVEFGISAYKTTSSGEKIIRIVVYGAIFVTPLWLLTRIEKFYLWTLREVLHHNTVMPQTEQTNLIAKYDTIAPRASILGFYITRGRVASIVIAIFGSIAPKIFIQMYDNLGNSSEVEITQWW